MNLDRVVGSGGGESMIVVPTKDEGNWASGGGKSEGIVVESGEEGGIVEPPLSLACADLRQLVAGDAPDLRQM